NNQWGVPLTLMRLRPEHRAAVIEIAMNHPGEIAGLAAVALPRAAVITNAGSAHLEYLGSLEAIAREKAALGFALRSGQPLFAGAAAIEAYRSSSGRMEVRSVRGATLLVDCYNANPESTRAALETLQTWPAAQRRIAVLGDMLELGAAAPRLHAETAAAAGEA